MSDRVLKVALYSIGSTLLILIITIPLIAMLWISGIQYHSRWNILFFIAMITIFDLLAEYIGRMAVDGFATLFSWTSKKRLLLMITEGPTDEEFYKKVIEIVRKKNNCSKFNFDEIKYMCSNGIGNMHKNMLSKFKFELCEDKEYGNYEKIVCFCYDKDVFKQNNTNPPINRTKMKEYFEKYGANKIIEIIADNMIEDFFLLDIEGIKKYLKVKKNYVEKDGDITIKLK